MNGNEGPNQISSMTSINYLDENPYLAIGCNDGSVRIWRDCYSPPELKKSTTPIRHRSNVRSQAAAAENVAPSARLVLAFQGLEDVGPSKRGILIRMY